MMAPFLLISMGRFFLDCLISLRLCFHRTSWVAPIYSNNKPHRQNTSATQEKGKNDRTDPGNVRRVTYLKVRISNTGGFSSLADFSSQFVALSLRKIR